MSRMRGTPARSPYSTQEKFGTSGPCPCPCGGGSTVRGIGLSNGQCSTFRATCTITRLPSSGGNGRCRPDKANGIRGLLMMSLGRCDYDNEGQRLSTVYTLASRSSACRNGKRPRNGRYPSANE